MYHLAAYQAALNTATLTAIQALTDTTLTIVNTGFRLPAQMQLLAAAAQSLTISGAELTSPSLRINGNPEVFPLGASSVALSPVEIQNFTANPFTLPAQEQIDMLMKNSAGGSEQMFGLLWVTNNNIPAPPGTVTWVKLTSTTAAVARTWTNISLTFAQALPVGFWSVVGSWHFSTTGIAHRLIFPGYVWRPGGLSGASVNNIPWRGQTESWLGEMGRFVNDNPFQCEVLCNGTDSTHTLYVGLVKVGSLGNAS